MTTLFERRYRLRVNKIEITGLDIGFNIRRTLKPEPNTAEIQIYNLSPDSRAQIEENRTANVTLEAGYKEDISLIYSGELRDVKTEREGASIITTISSGDGEKKKRRKRVSKGYAPGTTIKQVVKDCAAAMGVGAGNVDRLGKVEFPRAGATYPNGTVLDGNAAEQLEAILRSAGLEYSIQDGQLQIVPRRQALNDKAVVLSPSSGLVGTASVSSDGHLHCNALMIPDIFPGRRLKVVSALVDKDVGNIQSRGSGRKHLEGFSGIFRAQTCEYTGDTSNPDDWNIAIEGDPLFRQAAA